MHIAHKLITCTLAKETVHVFKTLTPKNWKNLLQIYVRYFSLLIWKTFNNSQKFICFTPLMCFWCPYIGAVYRFTRQICRWHKNLWDIAESYRLDPSKVWFCLGFTGKSFLYCEIFTICKALIFMNIMCFLNCKFKHRWKYM